MSKRTVFDHLTEQLDSVVKGRRYIIAEIGKLKESVLDLEDKVGQGGSGGGGLGSIVVDLKGFMQQTIGTLGQLKTSFNNLNSLVTTISNQLQQLKASGVSAAPAASPATTQPAASTAARPTTTPTPTPTVTSTPKANPPPGVSAPAAAPASSSGGGITNALERVLSTASSGATSNQIGQMLDALRTSISKSDPLNPILFELSMEAGKLKSLGDKAMEGTNLQGLQAKVEKWKSKV